MNYGLEGRTALVCASSKGLGRACAEALAEEGVSLVLVARGPDALEGTAHDIRQRWGVQVTAVAADITEPQGRARALGAASGHALGTAGAFDIVVTNAGGPPAGDFRDWDTGVWQAALNANMLTPIELMRATIDGMSARGWGRIVNITSTAVKAPSPYLGLSNGARAGLTGFVAGLARQVAPTGVTINNLLPGTFATDRLAGNLVAGARQAGMEHEAYVDMRRQAIPARRFGDAAEFGAACAFLCSRQAAYITGQNLLIDGGAYPGTF
ncbi:SDR family oxidoreductase [Xylophilus sp. GOD-11R]|uniref:SDR family oxidoreductase n=1 Tax=Xylophilus sp. GOD-11R TaxID=3089814 RepID=UPI00298C382B|nr:SDR family oxidoreductase [Xylophilus sp. GOD-11R]WPB58389.1 SDR family oxidoreductase [Xylophilus sp. GOD-11R]